MSTPTPHDDRVHSEEFLHTLMRRQLKLSIACAATFLVALLGWLSYRMWHRFYTPASHVGLEMGTLYWHLVDVIWIFLFPLLYLTGHP